MSHLIALKEDQRIQRGKDLTELIEQDVRDRRPQLARNEFVRRQYFGPSADDSWVPRYDGQSDIELRVVTEKIEGAIPKISNAFWNADPVVNVHDVSKSVDEEQVDLNQAYVNYLFDQGIEGIYATSQMWFRNAHLDGASALKVWYDFSTRDTVLCESVKSWWLPEQPDLTGVATRYPRQKSPSDMVFSYFGAPIDAGPHSRGVLDITPAEGAPDFFAPIVNFESAQYTISFVEDSVVYEDVLVQFEDTDRTDEVMMYIHRPIVVHDGVRVEVVEFEDLIVPFRATNLQSAPRVTHQYWLTYNDIVKKVERGELELSDEDMEKLKAKVTSDRQEEMDEITHDKQKRQKDRVTGQTGRHSTPGHDVALKPYSDNKVLFFEVYCRDNITGGGDSEVVYQIPYALRKVVAAEYLEAKCPHGRRPFPDLHYLRVSSRWYSISMGEILAPIQVEVNAIVNAVNDAQELLNNPFFFYVPSAFNMDPQGLNGVVPGQGIPVGDINGISFPTFPQQPLANLSAVDSMLMFADRLTISPQASSGSNQTRNAPRTARGTLALLSEGNVKTDMFVDDAGRGGFPELAHQVHGLESVFGSDEKFFYVVGEKRTRRITQKEMRGRYIYKFHGNSVNTNREVMRQIAQTRFAVLSPDPLYMQDLTARQHLIDDFLRHYSEGADIEKLKPKLPGQTGDRLPLPPETSVRQMMQGMPLQAHPLEDHAAHIAWIDRFRAQKEFETLPEFAVALVASNYQQHVQFQQMSAAQGGAPQSPGTANNVPTSNGDLQGGAQ